MKYLKVKNSTTIILLEKIEKEKTKEKQENIKDIKENILMLENIIRFKPFICISM